MYAYLLLGLDPIAKNYSPQEIKIAYDNIIRFINDQKTSDHYKAEARNFITSECAQLLQTTDENYEQYKACALHQYNLQEKDIKAHPIWQEPNLNNRLRLSLLFEKTINKNPTITIIKDFFSIPREKISRAFFQNINAPSFPNLLEKNLLNIEIAATCPAAEFGKLLELYEVTTLRKFIERKFFGRNNVLEFIQLLDDVNWRDAINIMRELWQSNALVPNNTKDKVEELIQSTQRSGAEKILIFLILSAPNTKKALNNDSLNFIYVMLFYLHYQNPLTQIKLIIMKMELIAARFVAPACLSLELATCLSPEKEIKQVFLWELQEKLDGKSPDAIEQEHWILKFNQETFKVIALVNAWTNSNHPVFNQPFPNNNNAPSVITHAKTIYPQLLPR